MKHLTQILLSLSLVLGAASASAGPASRSSHDASASSLEGAAVTVRHKSKRSGARATKRGETGLAPTAGITASVAVKLETSRSASMQSFLGASVGRSVEPDSKKKPSRASKSKKADKPAAKFQPDPLDFLN